MNLKDIFDKAENGVLTYEQFIAAAGQSKFIDLSEGNYVAKQKYTDDLAVRDTRITELEGTVKTRDTDLESLKSQLESAGTDASKLNELTNNFAELQKKYDKDTKALAKQMKDQEYKFAVTEFANKQTFTSQAAKRDFVNTMLAKNLTLDGDTIIGATDFVNAYKQENADAFATETPQQDTQPKPHFASPTSPQQGTPADDNPFHFDFVGVRPH